MLFSCPYHVNVSHRRLILTEMRQLSFFKNRFSHENKVYAECFQLAAKMATCALTIYLQSSLCYRPPPNKDHQSVPTTIFLRHQAAINVF